MGFQGKKNSIPEYVTKSHNKNGELTKVDTAKNENSETDSGSLTDAYVHIQENDSDQSDEEILKKIKENWEVLLSADTCMPKLPSGGLRGDGMPRDYFELLKNLADSPKKIFIDFLIDRSASRKKTRIHNCPYNSMIVGQ